jgi:hypothetical protein
VQSRSDRPIAYPCRRVVPARVDGESAGVRPVLRSGAFVVLRARRFVRGLCEHLVHEERTSSLSHEGRDMAAPPGVVPLPNGGFTGYGVEPKRLRKLTKRYVSRMQAPKPQSPRQIRIPQVARTRRVVRRVARTTGSRGDPDPDPEQPAARFDGFAVASRRMHEHLCRRMGARKAAAA